MLSIRWFLFAALCAAHSCLLSSLRASLIPQIGYATPGLFTPGPDLNGINGLGIDAGVAYYAYGSNIWSLTLDSFALTPVGDLPAAHHGVSVVQRINGITHAAFAQTNAFDSPYHWGAFDHEGAFQYSFEIGSLFDAAVDSHGTLYLIAMPGFFQTAVFRVEEGVDTITVIEVAHIGGFSGGIAFDSQDRLYVAEQSAGHILRFTPEQLAAGGLTAADGEVVVNAAASYLCFDANDRLYAVTDYGNELGLYDPETGHKKRVVAIDEAGGYGIGWIQWDHLHRKLVAIHSDFSAWPLVSSDLHVIAYSNPDQGIPGTSTVFRGWIAAVEDIHRPNPDSGGFAMNDDYEAVTPPRAVIGRPAEFENFEGRTHVYSLGKAGTITLAFDDAIVNGPGPDFAVFENGFYAGDSMFAEFAFVEVATTTNAWARFPVTTFATNPVGPFDMVEVSRTDGVAGKTALEFGAPFDLEWLRHHPNVTNGLVDLDRIAYIRMIDIIGDGTTPDSFGNPIYDAHSSFDANTDGFDLRGIGVIHLAGITLRLEGETPVAAWYGYEGRTYQPQVMSSGVWQNLGGPITGTGGVHRVVMPDGSGAALLRMEQTIPPAP
jgi:hypothetical protein